MPERATYKTIRRLTAAEGYLELGLPERAIRELEEIEHSGALEAARQLLTGEALKAQERFHDAVEPLQRAVELLPRLHRKRAQLSLSECCHKIGRPELGEEVEEKSGPVDTPPVRIARLVGILRAPAGLIPFVIEIAIHFE